MRVWRWFALTPFADDLTVVMADASLHWLMTFWHWLGLPSSPITVCCDSVERNAPKNFWWYSSGFLPLLRIWVIGRALQFFFWLKLELLIQKRCSWVVELLVDSCELKSWYPHNTDFISPKELFLNRFRSSFALVTFLSTTSCGWWARREVKTFKWAY